MDKHFKAASILAHVLDDKFRIGKFRFGYSAIINLIPGFGDALDSFLSLYLVWIALQMKVPFHKILQMLQNIIVSFFIGLIPLLGDVRYVFFKANLKNLAILKSSMQNQFVEGEYKE